MGPIERRSISELIARYELEPSLRDVFVEGLEDQRIVRWVVQNAGLTDVSVLEISDVAVPSSIIQSYGLSVGRRGAVITLALELCRALSLPGQQVSCLADRDGEETTRFVSCPILLFTDFAAMELYFFDQRVIDKFFSVFIGSPAPASVLPKFIPVLHDLFAIRKANLSLNLGLDWMTFDRCCSLNDEVVEFDINDFVRRYLNRGAKLSELLRFQEEFSALRKFDDRDPRLFMNGHDFIALLRWFVRSSIGRNIPEDFLGRGLAASVESAWLMDHSLFIELLARIRLVNT
jgi:hypothetical protein